MVSKLDKFVKEHTDRAEAVRKVRVAKKKFTKYNKGKALLDEAYVLNGDERQVQMAAERAKLAELKGRGEKWTYAHPEYKELRSTPDRVRTKETYEKVRDHRWELQKSRPSSGIEAFSMPVEDKVVKFSKFQTPSNADKMEVRGQKKVMLSESKTTPDTHIVKTSKGTYLVADKMEVDSRKIRNRPDWERVRAQLSHRAKDAGAPISDLHSGNFGVDPEGNLRIIDAGFDRLKRPPTPDMEAKIIKRTISKGGDAFRKLSKLTKHLPMVGGLMTAYSALTSPSAEAATEEVLSEFDPFGIALPEKVNVGDDKPHGGLDKSAARSKYLEFLEEYGDK